VHHSLCEKYFAFSTRFYMMGFEEGYELFYGRGMRVFINNPGNVDVTAAYEPGGCHGFGGFSTRDTELNRILQIGEIDKFPCTNSVVAHAIR